MNLDKKYLMEKIYKKSINFIIQKKCLDKNNKLVTKIQDIDNITQINFKNLILIENKILYLKG
jgi:hypothetical protein